ncbi:MAG: response regulator [Anaerolineae bacterium]|jgi:CheY-like chemotaxis protein|nr:response regulator [Anaerolineae bacterium]
MKPNKDILKGWKLLIVEDEPDNLDVIGRILNHFGATIETATDGKEGLAALERFTPDVIISDISMPVMDGWEFCYTVQNTPAIAHIPLIALTAHAMLGDRERALAAGFSGYITKPITPGTFITQLLEHLQMHPSFKDRFHSSASQA